MPKMNPDVSPPGYEGPRYDGKFHHTHEHRHHHLHEMKSMAEPGAEQETETHIRVGHGEHTTHVVERDYHQDRVPIKKRPVG